MASVIPSIKPEKKGDYLLSRDTFFFRRAICIFGAGEEKPVSAEVEAIPYTLSHSESPASFQIFENCTQNNWSRHTSKKSYVITRRMSCMANISCRKSSKLFTMKHCKSHPRCRPYGESEIHIFLNFRIVFAKRRLCSEPFFKKGPNVFVCQGGISAKRKTSFDSSLLLVPTLAPKNFVLGIHIHNSVILFLNSYPRLKLFPKKNSRGINSEIENKHFKLV